MDFDRRASRSFTNGLTRALWMLILAAAVMAPSTLSARDRPGTPNNESAWMCNKPLSQPPAVCVEFNNTASESVGFDIEFTVDGVKVVDNRPRATEVPRRSSTPWKTNCFGQGCPTFQHFPEHAREAIQNFNATPDRYAHAEGKTGSDNGKGFPVPPQGFMIPKLDYGSTYCFRFKARRASDDVVSAQWSNWACANADAAPPPRPSAPDYVTAEYTAGGKDWRTKPPKVVVEWGNSSNAAEYSVTGGNTVAKTIRPGDGQAHKVVDTLRESDIASNERSPSITYSVCAKNITGKTCTTASTYVPPGESVGRGSIPMGDVTLPPPPKFESKRNIPLGGFTMPTGPTSSDRVTHRNAASDPATSRPNTIVHDGFTGTWATVTSSGQYTMNLMQIGDGVKGSYTSAHGGITGTIDGRIEGGVLVYRWTEGNSQGSGKFTLAAGGMSFQGWWSSGDDPNVAQNSWNGTRQPGLILR